MTFRAVIRAKSRIRSSRAIVVASMSTGSASRVTRRCVINSVRQTQKVSGIQKVHAVVGGFHLAPAPDEIVAKTVAVFKDINPD
jgi:hypothetical protein